MLTVLSKAGQARAPVAAAANASRRRSASILGLEVASESMLAYAYEDVRSRSRVYARFRTDLWLGGCA